MIRIHWLKNPNIDALTWGWRLPLWGLTTPTGETSSFPLPRTPSSSMSVSLSVSSFPPCHSSELLFWLWPPSSNCAESVSFCFDLAPCDGVPVFAADLLRRLLRRTMSKPALCEALQFKPRRYLVKAMRHQRAAAVWWMSVAAHKNPKTQWVWLLTINRGSWKVCRRS